MMNGERERRGEKSDKPHEIVKLHKILHWLKFSVVNEFARDTELKSRN